MKRATHRQGSATLIVLALLAALGLAGCGDTAAATDLSTPEKVTAVPCSQVSSVTTTVTELIGASAPGERNRLRHWGLDPNDNGYLERVTDLLQERQNACQSETASPSPTSSPSSSSATATATGTASPTSAPTASATPSDSPSVSIMSPTGTVNSSALVGWDQVPANLQGEIDSAAAESKFTWADTQTWAKAKMPDGKFADARVVVFFGETTLSDDTIRQMAADSSKAPIYSSTPVVHATDCYFLGGNPGDDQCPIGDQKARVILAPLVVQDGAPKFRSPVTTGLLTDDRRVIIFEQR